MNILIVGAHPDDYEIGMAGTIFKHTSREDKVYAVIMSDGEKIGDPRKRHKESKLSASMLGIKKIWFLKFKDTMVPFNVDSIEKIECIIRKYNIERIYTHSSHDTHQDHQNTCKTVMSAGRKVKQILFFESPSSDPDFRPTFFVNIEKHLNIKIKALSIFKSLKRYRKRYFEIKAIRDSASFRGYQSNNIRYAESFEVFKFIEK